MKILLAQINPKIGDIEGNSKKILEFCDLAKKRNANLVVFPEMSLLGYPPKDLIYKPQLLEKQNLALERIAQESSAKFGIIVGGISANQKFGKKLFNSIFCLANGKVELSSHKTLLPSYDVFDETRYFEAAKESLVWDFMNYKLGLSICEDIWIEELGNLYSKDPITELVSKDADLIINCSASPYSFHKALIRQDMIAKISQKFSLPIIYVNQVGANDELIFDGASLVFNKQAKLVCKLQSFVEDQALIDLDELDNLEAVNYKQYDKTNIFGILDSIDNDAAQELESALILGLKDYIHKCNFSKVVIGLSGGIDSALVAYLAAKALGKENVYAYMLPSEFTSQASLDDAQALAKNLGINYQIVSIAKLHDELRTIIQPPPSFSDPQGLGIQSHSRVSNFNQELVDENLQPRIRANILMAFANSLNGLLLATSNKSEIAVGYSTLYGDSCGAIAVIGDLLKTTIYKLCDYINRDAKIIPSNIIHKAPSAELRHNQKDSDSLPEYAILDKIILLYVQELKTPNEIIDYGFDSHIVTKVLNLIDRAEYKRQQAPPILKVASKAFGIGRRMPIAQGFKNE